MNKFAIEEVCLQLENERKQINDLLTMCTTQKRYTRLGYLTGSLMFAAAWMKTAIENLGAVPATLEDLTPPPYESDELAVEAIEPIIKDLIKAVKNDSTLFADKAEAKWYHVAIGNAYTYLVNVLIQIDIVKKAVAEEAAHKASEMKISEPQSEGEYAGDGDGEGAGDGDGEQNDPEAPAVTMTVSNSEPEAGKDWKKTVDSFAKTGSVNEPPQDPPAPGGDPLPEPPAPEEPLQGDALIAKQKADLATVEELNLKSLKTPQANAATTEGTDSTARKNKNKSTGNTGRKKQSGNNSAGR